MSDGRDHWVAIPGGRLFVRRWPSKSALAPLILMHDSLGCVDLWGSFPAALARATGREIIAYDRYGYGKSSPRVTPLAPNFIREEAEEFFPLVLAALDVAEFCLLGHSVGGGMSVTIAAQHPGRCTAIVSESAQALIEKITVDGIVAARAAFENPARLARLAGVHGDKAADILKMWSDAWLKLDPSTWSLTADLPPLACPLLVVHGDADEFGTLASPRILAAYGGPLARQFILPGVGHIPHRERRDDVLSAIMAFLRTAR